MYTEGTFRWSFKLFERLTLSSFGVIIRYHYTTPSRENGILLYCLPPTPGCRIFLCRHLIKRCMEEGSKLLRSNSKTETIINAFKHSALPSTSEEPYQPVAAKKITYSRDGCVKFKKESLYPSFLLLSWVIWEWSLKLGGSPVH